MNVTVIGSGGFLGTRLVCELVEQGCNVNAVSSSGKGGIDPRTGLPGNDFAIPGGTDCAIYLAQSPFYRDLPRRAMHLLNVNCVSAARAGAAARMVGVKRFLYASTGSVYEPSFSPLGEDSPLRRDEWYALSKLHAEEILAMYRSSMRVTIVRPFGIYGPGQRDKLVPSLIERVRSGEPVRIDLNPNDSGDLDGLRVSLCHVCDAARVFARLATTDGPDVLNLAGPAALSVRQMVSEIADVLDMEAKFEIADTARRGDLVADTSRLESVIDWRFVDFSTGIRETLRAAT